MKRIFKSLIPFGVACMLVIAAFTSGVSTSCKRAESESDCVILRTNSAETIDLVEGTMMIVKEVKGDTVTVDIVSDDDCRAQLEEHGQG